MFTYCSLQFCDLLFSRRRTLFHAVADNEASGGAKMPETVNLRRLRNLDSSRKRKVKLAALEFSALMSYSWICSICVFAFPSI
jgi:hypothetical protein